MSKWNIKFNGTNSDLHVDEFLFRTETLARSAGINLNALPLGMHYVLHGQAQDWYWIYHRDFPDSSWAAMKLAIRDQFSPLTDEFELWDQVRARKQQQNENFCQFYLAIATMVSRFDEPITEARLVNLLRSNMSLDLKRVLLYRPTNTLRELQEAAKQYEKLGVKQDSNQSSWRSATRKVNELDYHHLTQPLYQVPMCDVYGTNETTLESYGESSGDFGNITTGHMVEAVTDRRIVRPNMPPPICWNCDDIGHTFQDCQVATRNVFCYGCGAKNTYRPNCSRCTQGNGKASGSGPGQFRSSPNVTRQDPKTILRHPNSFTKQ